MKMIHLVIVLVLFIVVIGIFRACKQGKCVEELLVKPETVYVETTERETIRIVIDSITRVLNYRTVNEDKLYEAINDTDSVVIVNLFYELVTGRKSTDENGGNDR